MASEGLGPGTGKDLGEERIISWSRKLYYEG